MPLRRSLRALSSAAYTALMAAATGAGVVAFAASPRRRAAWRDRMTHRWARGLARILALRIDLRGAPPPRGALLVANHLSYLDIVLLAACVPCGFVAKAEVRSWPGIGWVCRLAGVVFVDRARKRDAPRAAGAMERALEHGRTMVLFPEGTSTDGSDVLPFRSALLAGAARDLRPVWCATLAYRVPNGGPSAASAVAWTGDDAFGPHVWNLLALPAIEAWVRLDTRPLAIDDRKALAASLRERVLGELDELRRHLAPAPENKPR